MTNIMWKNIQTCDQEERRRLRDLRAEREARSLAIEKAYVHDVYEQVKLFSVLHRIFFLLHVVE